MATVYKVVRRRRDGKLTSAAVRARGLLRLYRRGVETRAPDGLKLLACKDLPSAENFRSSMILTQPYQIWEAEACNPQPKHRLLIFPWLLERGDVKKFWHEPPRAERRMDSPDGTVACDSITLVKRVDGPE